MKNTFLLHCFLFILGACGASTTEENGDSSDDNKPSDSSGKSTEVDIIFATHMGNPSLNLNTEETEETLDLGNGIKISTLEAYVDRIKLKATSDDDESDDSDDSEDSDDDDSSSSSALTENDDKNNDKKSSKSEDDDSDDDDSDDDDSDDDDGDEDSGDDDSTQWQGPYLMNLLSKTTTPSLDSASVLDGTYKRIEFRMRRAKDLDKSEKLYNNSFYLAGSVTINETPVAFEVFLNKNEKFTVSDSSGIKADSEGDNLFAISFDVEEWFTGIDFSTATPEQDGSIIISSQSNKALHVAFHKNMKGSAKVGKDEDKDGKLEDDEIENNSESSSEEEQEED